MPIVRNTLSVTQDADGSASCILRMYDQDDISRGQMSFRTDAGPDLQSRAEAQAALYISQTNEDLANREYEQIIGTEE